MTGEQGSTSFSVRFSKQSLEMILLDIIPTIEHFERANMEFAMGIITGFGWPKEIQFLNQ